MKAKILHIALIIEKLTLHNFTVTTTHKVNELLHSIGAFLFTVISRVI